MCGLAGVVGRTDDREKRAQIVRRMTRTLDHRGPDGEGFTDLARCSLGFRRLSIIDLAAPPTPFCDERGNVWSVCNGQIYNSASLREALGERGHTFRTETDTEVLPHLYEEHGVDLVGPLNGMFTFALWDDRKQLLVIARDRAGEKPLYYWEGEGQLVFASELRALLAHPDVPRAVDPVALRRYLLHDYIPGPYSPIAGVRKLRAGHRLIYRDGEVTVEPYWDLAPCFRSGVCRGRSEKDLTAETDARIAEAVRRRRRSDVPVGVFLSGGLDSATVLAHLSDQVGPGVPAFGIGHVDPEFDESADAKETARALGAEFFPVILGESELDEGLRRIGEGMDEPLGDASTLPTHLLARFARNHVGVVLSGEGADELFAGYPTYIGNRVASYWSHLPGPLQRTVAAGLRKLAPVSMGNVGTDYLLERFISAAEAPPVERHHRWFGSLPPERHDQVLSPQMRTLLAEDDPFACAKNRVAGHRFPDGLAELLYTDFTMYLQDDLLTKVDRATMLASLEARAPFLDHDLAEFVAALPSRHKLRGTNCKRILRRAARKRVPEEVLTRRKRGFNIPFSRWLLRGLGGRLQHRFSRERMEARGLFSHEGVRRLLDEHLERRADHRKPLFSLLALDLWCDRTYGEGQPVPVADASSLLQVVPALKVAESR